MIEGRDYAAASMIGARRHQEDDWGTHVNPPAEEAAAGLLAAVADGMGGMPAGDRASDIAIRTFLNSYLAIRLPARDRLRRALAHANREVGIAVEADPDLAGMGCTLVAALFFPDRCEWLSVGDSFILRCRDGQLECINPLHVYANELDEQVRRGEITAGAARDHPDRAALTSAVQGTVLGEVAQGELRLAPGDVVLLASDGIATLADEEIGLICARHADEGAVRIADAVIEQIGRRGWEGQDNATVIAVRQSGDKDDDTLVVREATDAKDTDTEESEDRESDLDVSAGASDAQGNASAKTPFRPEPVFDPHPDKRAGTVKSAANPAVYAAIAFVFGLLSGIVVWYAISLM